MVSLRNLTLLLCLGALSCSGFKSEKPLDGGPRDLGPGDLAPWADVGWSPEQGPIKDLPGPERDLAEALGPGPWGALPTGYCCTSKDQCRYRNCLEINGTRMCSDECSHAGGCQGNLPGFTCVGSPIGRCEPADAQQACVPADTYARGLKTLGQCCVATNDGAAGLECEGGRCAAFGALSNPFFCTHVCTEFNECPFPFTCSSVGDHAICVNLAESYLCE